MLGSPKIKDDPDVKMIPQKNAVREVLSMPETAFREVYEWSDGSMSGVQPGILHNPPGDIWRKNSNEYKKVFTGNFSSNSLEQITFHAKEKKRGNTKVFILLHDNANDKLTDVRGLMSNPQFNGATFQFASTMFGPLEGGKYVWKSKLNNSHVSAVQGEFASISTMGATIWRKYFLPGILVENFINDKKDNWKDLSLVGRTKKLTRKMYMLEHFGRRLPYKVIRRPRTSYRVDEESVKTYNWEDGDLGLVKVPIHKDVYVLYGYGSGKDSDGNDLPGETLRSGRVIGGGARSDDSLLEVIDLKRKQLVSCVFSSTIDIKKYRPSGLNTREKSSLLSFQKLLQEAAYTGAIYGAVWTGSKKVVLTFVGGGSFINDPSILYDKMLTVLKRAIDDKLDIEIYINYRYDYRRESAVRGVEKKNLKLLIKLALETQGVNPVMARVWETDETVDEYIEAYAVESNVRKPESDKVGLRPIITKAVNTLYALQKIELVEKKEPVEKKKRKIKPVEKKKREKKDIKEPLHVFTAQVEGKGAFSRPRGDTFDGQEKDAMVAYPGDPLWLARNALSGKQARELMLAYDFYIRYTKQLQLLLNMATESKQDSLTTKFLLVLSQMEAHNRNLEIWIESVVKQENPKGKESSGKSFEMHDLLLVLRKLQSETSSILANMGQEAQALRASGVKKEPIKSPVAVKPKAELPANQKEVLAFMEQRMTYLLDNFNIFDLDIPNDFFNFSEIPVLYSMVHDIRGHEKPISITKPMDIAMSGLCTFSNGYPVKGSSKANTKSGFKSIQLRIQLSPDREAHVLLFQFTIEYASMSSVESPVKYELHTARFGYATTQVPGKNGRDGMLMYVFTTPPGASSISIINKRKIQFVNMDHVQYRGSKDKKRATKLFLPLDSEEDPEKETLRIQQLFSDVWNVTKKLEPTESARGKDLPLHNINMILSVTVNVEAVATTKRYNEKLGLWRARGSENPKPTPTRGDIINVHSSMSRELQAYNYYNMSLCGVSEDKALLGGFGPDMLSYAEKIHRFTGASTRSSSRIREEISETENLNASQGSVFSTKESSQGAVDVGEEENKCNDLDFLGVVEEL